MKYVSTSFRLRLFAGALLALAFLAFATDLQAATSSRPLFLVQTVDDIAAGGHTYQIWYTSACIGNIPDPFYGPCQCDAGASDNDCLATQDSDGDGKLETIAESDGDSIPDIVDPDFTTGWGNGFSVESIAYNIQQTIDVYVNDWNLREPAFTENTNRDIRVFDIDVLGVAYPDGSRFELDAATMLGGGRAPRSTVLHEMWHMTQFAYNAHLATDLWYIEGQARFLQDKVFSDMDNDSTSRFVNSVKTYLNDPTYPEQIDIDDDGTPEVVVPVGLLGAAYDASLWWNYMTEQAGAGFAGTAGEGMDFVFEVIEQSAKTISGGGVPLFGATAVNFVLANRIGRGFDAVWWDFTIANFTKNLDLAYLDPAKLDGRDPTQVLTYQDEQAGEYGQVARTTVSSNDFYTDKRFGRVDPVEFSVTVPAGQIQFNVSGQMPGYGAMYWEGELPTAADCPVATWTVIGDVNADLYHSFLLLREDTDGNFVEEVVDLERHQGDTFDVSVVNLDSPVDYHKIVGIVATRTEPEGFDWTMSCTLPDLNILAPDADDPAPVGAPDNPGNFELRLEVKDTSGGTPLSGLDPTLNFTVTVGGDPATILSGDYVQDQYWLVVRAPEKPSATTGDTFEVRAELVGTNAADTAADAVLYDYLPTDVAIILDRSGSMTQNGKLGSAKAAGRSYASTTQQGDKLGVVSFSDNAQTDFAMTDVPDQDDAAGVRANAHTAIDAIAAANQTSIGDGLALGRTMLNTSGNPDHKWVMVLLSDGLENRALFWNDVKNDVIATGADVHTIALGGASDPGLLHEIARLTCGDRHVDECFWPVNDNAVPVSAAAAADLPNVLVDTYLRISETANKRQRLWERTGSGSQTLDFELADADVRRALFTIAWKDPAAPASVSINGPAGVTFIPRQDGKTHQFFYSDNLDPGKYTVTIGGSAEWIVSLSAVVPEGVELRSIFDNTPSERIMGEPARLRVSLVDQNGPVAGATVTAKVYRPDGVAVDQITLEDAGGPYDNRPGDGIYSYDYDRINTVEQYNFTFEIVATGPDFERYKRVTYRPYVTSSPDSNNDNLNDNWQQRFDVVGGNNDTDRDGLTHDQEEELGTDPTRADTDRGGEMDGSEFAAGRNPLDAGDDALPPLRDFSVENGVQEVILRFNPQPEYDQIRVFQKADAQPYSPVGIFPANTGKITITNLINDKDYLFRIQALGQGGVQGALAPAQFGEPAADPEPPEGSVFVNGNAQLTNNTTVTLDFIPGPDTTHMKVGNSPNLLAEPWQAITPQLAWDLDPDPATGTATVWVQFRDSAGNVSAYAATDSIIYDPSFQPDTGQIVGNDDAELEVGAWVIADYPPQGPGGADLPAALRDGAGLVRTLTAPAAQAADSLSPAQTAPWKRVYTLGNRAVTKNQWLPGGAGGGDDAFVDAVDFAYFVGQARKIGLAFLINKGSAVTVLTPDEAVGAYGDQDLDYLGLSAGRALHPSNLRKWGAAMNGLRLIFGFESPKADVPHGARLGNYVRTGYPLVNSWLKATDVLQPAGATATVLAEHPDYFADDQSTHDADTTVDDLFCAIRHSTGDRATGGGITSSTVGRKLPTVPLPVLTPTETADWFKILATQFGVPAAGSITDGTSNTLLSADGQLEVDAINGSYHYLTNKSLWESPQAAAGQRLYSEKEAQSVADQFLAQSGLLPNGYLFKEVVTDRLACLTKAGSLQAQATADSVEPLLYQVIYEYGVLLTPLVPNATRIPVEGPGARLKVYVKAKAPIGAAPADMVVGMIGTYKVITAASEQMVLPNQASDDVTVLDYEQIEKVLQSPDLTAMVALGRTDLDDVEETEILTYTLAYWQDAIGSAQPELVPIYRLLVSNKTGDEVVQTAGYLPASPQYMPPLARIASVRVKDGAEQPAAVAPGSILLVSALPAETPLDQAGYDASLNFVLGSDQALNYLYNWYWDDVTDESRIGQGREVEVTVEEITAAAVRDQTLILEVVDTAGPGGVTRSYATYDLQVGEFAFDLYLPDVQR